MKEYAEQINALRVYLSRDIHQNLWASPKAWVYPPLSLLLRLPLQRFAELGARFDDWVRHSGFVEATRLALPRFIDDYRAHGLESIPRDGPLLITANHPGAYDALLIAACVGRNDLKIVANDIGFLRGLPFTREHILFRAEAVHARVSALRSAIRHLRGGGTVLIFPSGQIDPDPEILPGGKEALCDWSSSIELMMRHAPETRVLVTIVSGVLSAGCVRNPLTRIRRKESMQQGIAEGLQIIQQVLFDRRFALFPRLSFAEPVTLADLNGSSGFPDTMEALIDRAQGLFTAHNIREYGFGA
jgi:hypothetical protein